MQRTEKTDGVWSALSWWIEHSESTPCRMQHYLIFWCRLLGKQTHGLTQRAARRVLEGLDHHKSVALWIFFFNSLAHLLPMGNGPWRRLRVRLDLIAPEASPSPRRPLRPLPTHDFEEIWSGLKKNKKYDTAAKPNYPGASTDCWRFKAEGLKHWLLLPAASSGVFLFFSSSFCGCLWLEGRLVDYMRADESEEIDQCWTLHSIQLLWTQYFGF